MSFPSSNPLPSEPWFSILTTGPVSGVHRSSFWLFTLARWACIPFSLLGGYICYRWAHELFGPAAGLLALALWCFCPNILGHGSLITPDMGATSLGLAACYTFWLWLKQPDWRHAITSGLVLGVAELAKMTLIVFFAVWPIMWLVYRWSDRRTMTGRDWLRELGMLAARTVVAIYIINLGYGFEGTGTRLRDFRFVSATLAVEPGTETEPPAGGGNRFANSWLGALPVPLPKNYLQGIDLQKRDFEDYGRPSYLRGQWSPKGWWYYYLYALAIKVPLGTWLLGALAVGLRVCRGSGASWRDEFILLCPAFVILVFVSSQTGFSEHMRYVLPAFPFAFVWTSQVARFVNGQHKVVATVAAGALAWSIGSCLWFYPHSLSYFNELVGGPTGGPAHLLHSNVDWGQDLLFLKDWLDEHPEARPLKLAYFGYFDPIHAGIEYTAPEPLAEIPETPVPAPGLEFEGRDPNQSTDPSGPKPGWYALSVNYIYGHDRQYRYFLNFEPVVMAGYSIYIYHVPDGT